ncbi:MAG: MSCRAMM family protein, partial [Blastocatellia bacterium]
AMRMAMGNGTHYLRTFYPEAVEEAKAKIIEVRSGGEVESVDIKLASASKNKAFAATGRVVEAESGKPVAGVMIGYAQTKEGASGFGFGNSATNSAGEFHLEGLKPNSYQAFVIGLGASENYGDPLSFEITGSDVSGLEIKMHQGSSISGVAVIEGSNDPKLREKLAKIQLSVTSIGSTAEGAGFDISSALGATGQIAANGTFKVGGIRPGQIRITANTYMAEKGLSLSRIELNGTEIKELQLSAGERLNGVRLVFVYGTASIAGRVEVRGGTLPANVKLAVFASREGASEDHFEVKHAEVDARGQFQIEGLAAGNYRLTIVNTHFGPGERVTLPHVEQPIAVTGNGKQEIVLVLDLSKEEK